MPSVIDLTPLSPVAPAAAPNSASDATLHCDAPFRLDVTGRPVYVEQDSPADVAACVYRILSCPQGAKPGDPDFGIPWPLFQTAPLNTQAILAAVQQIEPRADLSISEVADAFNAAIRDLTVNVGVTVQPST
jgi:phage baseplate assembly protein W